MGTILTAFSPRSKQRPAEFSAEGDIRWLHITSSTSPTMEPSSPRFTLAKAILDGLKRLCHNLPAPDAPSVERFDALTKDGERMEHYQKLLAAAVASIVGKKEERSAASLFSPGGTHAKKGEFAGMNDFEVIMYLAILPEAAA